MGLGAMRFLFCCEFYYPSRGGVQEVMRQVAERMVRAGHDVTLATSYMPDRDFSVLNGVQIQEFKITGNRVQGMTGEVERYRRFLTEFHADTILINAAQQWTFDAAWPVLDAIRARKVFIPCGFSGLYTSEYRQYFEELPSILRQFDHLIFHAERYRDIDFVRHHGFSNLSVVPNGASEIEFAAPRDANFRSSLEIPEDDVLLLTVGSPINAKGHTELAAAFSNLDTRGRGVSLILNGQWASQPTFAHAPAGEPPVYSVDTAPIDRRFAAPGVAHRALKYLRDNGMGLFVRRVLLASKYRCIPYLRWTFQWLRYISRSGLQLIGRWLPSPFQLHPPASSIDDWIAAARRQPNKKVFKTYLSRENTLQAFLNSDLFVFASNTEYSPLVLFESAAAGTPFLTVPVGNAEEIVRWTGGGLICPAVKDERGKIHVDPAVLAEHISRLIEDADLRRRLGDAGREAWRSTYNWNAIAKRYEAILMGNRPIA